jgi:hypothetical protein
MKVEYRITEDDYACAARLHAWRHFISMSPNTKLLAFIIVVLAGIGLWERIVSVPGLIFIVLIISILGAINVFVLTPRRARRHYRRYTGIQELITAELTDAGIRFSNSDGEGVLPWPKVLQWRQNTQFVLIYPMPVMYYVVPKSIEREGFDIPLLVQRLVDHVGPER